MLTDTSYELLRLLASPVVAVTSASQGRLNGMILDSAIRASISPQVPRISVYVHKWHLSHEYIWETGVYGLHLLRRDQFDLIHQLGFASGRERDKLAGLAHSRGQLGVPLLEDCRAGFECQVVNAMDAGASTCFLADIVATYPRGDGDIMTADFFRANLPEAWREEFARNYREAQERIAKAPKPQNVLWPGPKGPT
jgi:flavin reductase (DIM6/NTAB) family NADH-FMN oxidoreductase RutF